MKSRVAFLFAIVLGIVATLAADKSTPAEDTAKLQGEWSMVSAERDGESLPADMVKTWKRVAKMNEVTVTSDGQLFMRASFSVDPSKQPKAIDYDVTGGPYAGKQQLGIYELSADGVKFCFALPGQPRPTEFTTKTDSGRTLSSWVKNKQ